SASWADRALWNPLHAPCANAGTLVRPNALPGLPSSPCRNRDQPCRLRGVVAPRWVHPRKSEPTAVRDPGFRRQPSSDSSSLAIIRGRTHISSEENILLPAPQNLVARQGRVIFPQIARQPH